MKRLFFTRCSMTLQQINYLLTISESRSMNKAAEKLFIAQPTLTGAVRDVENELGIQIFTDMIPNSTFVDILIFSPRL